MTTYKALQYITRKMPTSPAAPLYAGVSVGLVAYIATVVPNSLLKAARVRLTPDVGPRGPFRRLGRIQARRPS
jgi:hypothetical protein